MSPLEPRDVIGSISAVTTIAAGNRIRELDRLLRRYGRGEWRKCRGIGSVRLPDGTVRRAEIHWYEAHGIGKREMKVKRYLRA
jgi:hypothetical protein